MRDNEEMHRAFRRRGGRHTHRIHYECKTLIDQLGHTSCTRIDHTLHTTSAIAYLRRKLSGELFAKSIRRHFAATPTIATVANNCTKLLLFRAPKRDLKNLESTSTQSWKVTCLRDDAVLPLGVTFFQQQLGNGVISSSFSR